MSKECTNRFFPHPRTLRKAWLQINIMVYDGFSDQRIKNYLHQWVVWWLRTADIWEYDELLNWFINACFENNPAKFIGARLLKHHSKAFAFEEHLYPAR